VGGRRVIRIGFAARFGRSAMVVRHRNPPSKLPPHKKEISDPSPPVSLPYWCSYSCSYSKPALSRVSVICEQSEGGEQWADAHRSPRV
jgi:hypothetical protein